MQGQENPSLQNPKHDGSLFEVELSFLEHIKKTMLPHQKQFNIIEFFEIIIDYSMKIPNQSFESLIPQDFYQSSINLNPESQSSDLKLKKTLTLDKSTAVAAQVKQRKIKYAEQILDKLKNVFLWYRKKTISYEMINNYILSYQNRTLKDINALQNLAEYQHLPHRRVRLDENVKLCIMPQGDSSKIKFLSINPVEENRQDIFCKEIFVVTSEYIRSIRVDGDKLAKEGNKTIKIKDIDSLQSNKISIVKNWYTYDEEKIIPQSREEEKGMKINAKKQLYIEKVAISEHLIGIITHEKEVLVKPFLTESEKHQRGRRIVPYQIRLGNLVQDVPDENLERPISQDTAKAETLEKSKILMFECYNDDIWLVVSQDFVYVYILPLPDSNELINDQEPKSSMLALCEPLPVRCHQAKLLTKDYLAIMLQTPCVLILKLQLSSKKQLRSKNRIYPTNKIYNDIKFICMNYHPVDRQLIFTDFGSYLVRLKFNIADGDVEREGAVYDEETGKLLTENTTNTRRDKKFGMLKKQSEINIQSSLANHFSKAQIGKMTAEENKIKNSLSKKKESLTVWQNKGMSITNLSAGSQIHLSQHKPQNDKAGMSIYSKPQSTDFMKIVKNSSRQNMILLCLNKNSSTLITYEEMSVNPLKNGKQDDESDKDRLYDKTIKLWDMNHMNVYQTFTLSLQIAQMSLQSNGFYIVTKERGYLGYYPLLNKEQNGEATKRQANPLLAVQQKTIKPILNKNIMISGNQIFFSTLLQKERNHDKIQQQGYENHLVNYSNPVTTIYSISVTNQSHPIVNLEQIPAQITQISVRNKLYVLSDTSADKKYNIHIYDMLGNKEDILKGMQRTQKYSVEQNYTNFASINHFQFNILLWNKHSLKFLGSNLEESFTIHWTFNCEQRLAQKANGSEFDLRSLKSSVTCKQKQIEEIYIGQNSISIKEKMQNELYKMVTLSILHLDSGRIKYRINDIASSFHVIGMFNNILLTRQNVQKRSATSNEAEEIETSRKSTFSRSMNFQTKKDLSYPVNENEELINLYDFSCSLYRKCVFTFKYKTLIEDNMNVEQLKQCQIEFNNVVTHERFFIQKHISLKSARFFTLNNDKSFIVCLVFLLKQQHLMKNPNHKTAIQKDKIFHSTFSYLVYTREVSTEIMLKSKYMPHTLDASIKKVSRKAMSEYMGETQVHERILTHWQIDFAELMTRSTVRNLSYAEDLHSQTDEGVDFMCDDITDKILSFGQGGTTHGLLGPNQSISKIFQITSKHDFIDQISIDWVLAEAQCSRSIIKLSSPKFFELHSQQISFNEAQKKLSVSLDKICRIALDQRSEQPIVKEWNAEFNSENKEIWEETKYSMVEYIKHKLSKQTQKHLNSPTNLIKKNSKSPEKSSNFLTLTSTQTQDSGPALAITPTQKNPLKSHFNSNQLNNMFRQWHINKNIQKEMNEYANHSTQAQNQLQKQLKHIIDNPEAKEKRIQYLLSFPQKIKDPRLGTAMELISKNLNYHNSLNKIFSMISLTEEETKNNIETRKKKRNSDQESLEKRVQLSLQRLQATFSLPKITANQQKTTKSVFASSKFSELKQTKKDSGNSRIHSSLGSENNEALSPIRITKNSQSLKSTKNGHLVRTKTETSGKSYLDLIAETPFELLASNENKDTMNDLYKKVHSPNPESSLSNIRITNPKNQVSPAAYNLSSIVMKSPFTSPNTLEAKKSKSILTRAKTQTSISEEQTLSKISSSALVQLKQSSVTMSKSILPQIKINREKLNQKMKQKKSFLKAVNERLCFTKEEIKEEIVKNKKEPKLQRLHTLL